jgi:DNA mismatch repair protein MLH1
MSQHGSNRADVHSASTTSRLDAIRNVYGASVVRDLMEIEVSDEDGADAVSKMNGYISNANYVAKKITMILFINGISLQSTNDMFWCETNIILGLSCISLLFY